MPADANQSLLETIGNYWKIIVASGAVGALLYPLIQWLAKGLWSLITDACTSLSRNKKFRKNYLSWLINANRYISILPTTLAGIKKGTLHRLELDQIYITLEVSRGEEIGRPQSLEDILAKNRKIIILGDPGAGKSTMMQYLALQAARQLTKEPGTLQYPLNGLPILIRLNTFADIEHWDKDKDLLAAIISDIQHNTGLKIPAEYLENQLRQGQCLILLDAFDELASDEARRLLAKKVKNIVAAFPDNQCLVTSRITGYSHQLAEAGFEQPFTIQKLSQDHIRTFVGKWYENLAALQGKEFDEAATASLRAEYQTKASNLMAVVLKNPGIRELAVNPMLLSLIALVHYVKVKLPEQRHRLYQECLDILIEQWDSIKDVKFPFLDKLEIQEKKRLLQRLAFHLHDRKAKSLPKSELVREALQPACQDICPEKIKENEMEKFLALIQERTGLLVEKGFNEQGEAELSFSHLTFQEYLAALELLDKYENEETAWQEIRTRMQADPAWWQETAVLYLSQMKKRDHYLMMLSREILDGEASVSQPMFDPRLKLLARSFLEFPAALSGEDYHRLLKLLLTHFNFIPPGNLSLLASHDRERHLLKYLAQHYDARAGDFFLEERQLYPKIEEMISYLQGIVTDQHSSVFLRGIAAEALGRLCVNDQRVVDALLRALGDGTSYVWMGAAKALGRLGVKDQRVLDQLLRALGAGDRDDRQEAAEALGLLGVKDQRVVDAILKALGDGDWYVRLKAAEALGRLGFNDQRVVDALLRDLEDGNTSVRLNAAEALGRLGVNDQRVVDALLEALGNRDSYVRWGAVEALGRLGVKDQRVVFTLLQALGDGYWNVRQGAVEALGRLGVKDQRVVFTLLQALGDGSWNVRRMAAIALGHRRLSVKIKNIRDIKLLTFFVVTTSLGHVDFGDEA